MPDHVHGIIQINNFNVGEGLKPSPTINQGLYEIIRGFKTISSRWINALRNTSGIPVWQRSFYDHIIRDDTDLDHIRAYINNNPCQPLS